MARSVDDAVAALRQTRRVLPLQILGGRYRLDEVLGVGGMSVVWRATDDVLGRRVAVKILAGEFAADPEARAAVLSEAQAVARLSHPNICNVFDYGESLQADGQTVPYVVMELLSGPSLSDRLESGPLPPHEALRVAAEVAAGLAAAHAHGIVHRDVKPGNVILTESGAKVFDFGIAALAGAPDEAGPDGRILATISCVAPERLHGGIVLPASDMFAWGVLLFRLLTGRLPWPTWTSLADRLASLAPLPAIDGVPAKIGELYLSCLAREPEARPSANSAAAVLQLALAVRTPRSADVLPPGGVPEDITDSIDLRRLAETERRRRHRRVLALAGGLAAVVAAGAIALASGNAPSDPSAPNSAGPSGAVATGAAPSTAAAEPTDSETQDPFPDGAPTQAVPGAAEVIVPPDPGPPEPTGAPSTAPEPTGSFSSPGGRVVAVCRPLGAFPTLTEATPGYVIVGPIPDLQGGFWIFFTKAPDGDDPRVTYRLAISCEDDGEPSARLATIFGDETVGA